MRAALTAANSGASVMRAVLAIGLCYRPHMTCQGGGWFVLIALLGGVNACATELSASDARCTADAPWWHSDVTDDDDFYPPVPSANESPLGGICDGSDQLRLVVASQGFYNYSPLWWQAQIGRPLLIVDGHCHYYASKAFTIGQVVEGQLTAAMLEQLTEELALDHLAELPSRRDDCGSSREDRLIATQDQSLRCRCDDCGADVRSTRAVQNGAAWIERLADEGTPRTGVLRAIARFHELPRGVVTKQPVFDWPLQQRLHQVVGLVAGIVDADDGIELKGADAAALRELRTQTLTAAGASDDDRFPTVVLARECGAEYELNLRRAAIQRAVRARRIVAGGVDSTGDFALLGAG